MPTTPVDDHTEEFEQLAGLAALDVLEGAELARFEQHSAHCERCRLMVRGDREALAHLAPELDPSPGFKERLLQRAATELETQRPAPEPVPLRQPPNVSQFPWWRRQRWATALAAVLLVALVSAGAFSYENQVIASYPLTGTVAGSVVVNVRRSGAAELQLRGVQNPQPGFLYEAWIIPQGAQPIPAGTTSTGDATLSLSNVPNGATIAITLETAPVQAPTSTPILATQVAL